MQIALLALICPPIDSTLHRLELICRPVWFLFFFFFLDYLPYYEPHNLPSTGGKKKKKCYGAAAVIKTQVPIL